MPESVKDLSVSWSAGGPMKPLRKAWQTATLYVKCKVQRERNRRSFDGVEIPIRTLKGFVIF